jgi:transcriptional regulator with XRE-family HTH domain
MNEGARIKELLDQRGLTIQDLARACGVKWPSAQKYVRAETLAPAAWVTCSQGLEKLGIDPQEIRRSVRMFRSYTPPPPAADVQDLRPHIEGFTKAQLRALKEILEADDAARERLSWIIDDRLNR